MGALLDLIQKATVFLFLVGSMMAMGLNLKLASLGEPLRRAPFVVRALGINFVLAPALAWLLTTVIPIDRGHAAGLLLLGGAAGAPFLPKLVETARGDVARSVALMVLLTVGTIIFMPFALPHLIGGMKADSWSIARPLVLLILLPLAVGMVVRSEAASLAARIAPLCARLGNAALLLLFVLLVARNIAALVQIVGSGAILATLLFFTGLLASGWVLGGLDREVLSLATVARNFGAALVPASSFGNPQVPLMIVVGAIVCLVVSFVAAGSLRRRSALRTPM